MLRRAVEAELAMISENLHRADLTALQRDEQLARWIELVVGMTNSQSANKSKMGRPTTVGVAEAERSLGIKKDDAHRAVKVASLTEEAKEAAKQLGLESNRTANKTGLTRC